MADPRMKNSYDFLPQRKDQRFPPRYESQRKPIKGKGLSAIFLIRKAAKTQIVNSKYVQIKSIQRNKNKPLLKFTTITRVPGEDPRVHTQRVYAADPNYQGPLYECPAIKVACSCGNHLFQHEVALATRGGADIIYSNGDFPIITNPSLKPTICKHILKCLMLIVHAKI